MPLAVLVVSASAVLAVRFDPLPVSRSVTATAGYLERHLSLSGLIGR